MRGPRISTHRGAAWINGGEPNGTYVFTYVVHGTLNGTPVDLEASSKPIVMTD